MIKQFISQLKPPKYANCLIYIKQCKQVNRLTDITQPVQSAHVANISKERGFLGARETQGKEGGKCLLGVTVPLFLHINIHQVNVEIPPSDPSLCNYLRISLAPKTPFPFFSNACHRGQTPLNTQFVAQLPWQYFSAVKSVTGQVA